MREIKFKAKEIQTDKWVFGFYECDREFLALGNIKPGISHTISGHYENPSEEDLKMGNVIFDIDKDTLCQFTGLTDSNGDYIYENDILKISHNGVVKKSVVKWSDINARYVYIILNGSDETFDFTMNVAHSSTICSNIHDSGEVL